MIGLGNFKIDSTNSASFNWRAEISFDFIEVTFPLISHKKKRQIICNSIWKIAANHVVEQFAIILITLNWSFMQTHIY